MELTPIGYVRTSKRGKFATPNQPRAEDPETDRIELLPLPNVELALQDLDGFDWIWILSWFHQHANWRPRVMPPRGPAIRRGVFATRSPHRPNPIGLTSTRLHGIEGRTLHVGGLDLLDGTPVLDLKPYLRTVDAHPEASLGWVEAVEAAETSPPAFTVELEPLAERQLQYLRDEYGIDFTERAFAILRRDPSPHRTRRILQMPDGGYRLACGPWRLFFRRDDDRVRVERIAPGYPEEVLLRPGYERIADWAAQLEFRRRWANLTPEDPPESLY